MNDDVPGQMTSELIDLSEIDLDGLAVIDSRILARSLQRVRDEVVRPDEAVASFQSSL